MIHLFVSFTAFSALAAGASDDLFQKGLAAYQNKQYAEARDDFQKLLDQGKVTPNVLNNLALAAFQLDQKPLALALWRKALSLQPGFRPAKEGRDLLENKMGMRPFERDSLALWVHRTLESVSLFGPLCMNALWLALAGYFGLRYWGQRVAALDEEREKPPFPAEFACFAVLLALSLTTVILKIRDETNSRATVILPRTSARSLPAEDGVQLFELSGGSEVLVHREGKGWLQVQNADGGSGWVKSSDLMVTSDR